MSISILQYFQTNSKKETDNFKDRPAPHCGESPIPTSSLPAVAVFRPSLLRMRMMMMIMMMMMMCLIITSIIAVIDNDYCLLELPGLCSQSVRPRKQTPDIYLITTRSQISQRKKSNKIRVAEVVKITVANIEALSAPLPNCCQCLVTPR